jgi:hypothetical protein
MATKNVATKAADEANEDADRRGFNARSCVIVPPDSISTPGFYLVWSISAGTFRPRSRGVEHSERA